jgi:hypothetical protein
MDTDLFEASSFADTLSRMLKTGQVSAFVFAGDNIGILIHAWQRLQQGNSGFAKIDGLRAYFAVTIGISTGPSGSLMLPVRKRSKQHASAKLGLLYSVATNIVVRSLNFRTND